MNGGAMVDMAGRWKLMPPSVTLNISNSTLARDGGWIAGGGQIIKIQYSVSSASIRALEHVQVIKLKIENCKDICLQEADI